LRNWISVVVEEFFFCVVVGLYAIAPSAACEVPHVPLNRINSYMIQKKKVSYKYHFLPGEYNIWGDIAACLPQVVLLRGYDINNTAPRYSPFDEPREFQLCLKEWLLVGYDVALCIE
jgi:hypothetical protein